MSGSGDADPGPGSSGLFGLSSVDTGLSLSAGRVLPGRIRCLSNPAPAGRLPSLRTRDMTLGGAYKKPKKTFEPNVHAVRKSKDELKGKIQTASKPQRMEREEKRREKRGRRRERPPTIQSHSIFEQGPADSSRRPGCRGVADVRDSASSSVCKVVKEPEDDEEEILSKLHRDDFIDDLDLENRSKLKPIQLPLSQSVAFMKSPSLSRSSCVFGSVVHSPENPPLLRPQSTGGPGPAVCSRTEPRPPQPSLVDLLQELSLSGSEELFFMQLPDCMPFRSKETHKDRKTEDRRPGQEAAAKEACPVLSQFPEGFLGKLQIRRSGSVVLKVGDVVMDVSEGAAFSFLQQLVSVRLSDGQTGDMMVLGNIRHKLVLSPDFQTFLQQTATQQQQ